MNHPLMPVYRGVLVLLLCMSAQAFAADGVIREMSGGVFVNSVAASEGMEVNSGDSLSTGPGAWAIVIMTDGSVLNLKSDTKIEISDYVYDQVNPANNNIDTEITTGTLRYVSGLIAISDPGDVKFRAGNTTLGLRGTDFDIVFDGTDIKVVVYEGSITVQTPAGPVVVSAGQQITYESGQTTVPVPEAGPATPPEEGGGAGTTTLRIEDAAGRDTVVLAAGTATSGPTATIPAASSQGQSQTFSQDPVTGGLLGGDPPPGSTTIPGS